MAPKGGRGGSSGGSSSKGSSSVSCPNAFPTVAEQVYFSCRVVFAVVYFILLLFYVRLWKKNRGSKMLGWPVPLGILAIMLAYILTFINEVLQECQVLNYYDVYQWSIPINIFWYTADFLLLFVVVWTLNSSLRAQLGPVGKTFKAVPIAILIVMGILTLVEIVLVCYINWALGSSSRRLIQHVYVAYFRFDLAYTVLYLISVVTAGALALTTIISLRKRSSPAGDLLGWTITLVVFLIIYQAFQLSYSVASLRQRTYTFETYAALNYLSAFFRALCYVGIFYIGKHFAWGRTTPAITAEDPKHTYNEYIQPPAVQSYHGHHPPPMMYTNQGTPIVHEHFTPAPTK